jgi:hypothetical protein
VQAGTGVARFRACRLDRVTLERCFRRVQDSPGTRRTLPGCAGPGYADPQRPPPDSRSTEPHRSARSWREPDREPPGSSLSERRTRLAAGRAETIWRALSRSWCAIDFRYWPSPPAGVSFGEHRPKDDPGDQRRLTGSVTRRNRNLQGSLWRQAFRDRDENILLPIVWSGFRLEGARPRRPSSIQISLSTSSGLPLEAVLDKR